MTKTLFVSYSHKDEQHKDFVVGHLKVAERQGVFDVWDDQRIKGGACPHSWTIWREKIPPEVTK